MAPGGGHDGRLSRRSVLQSTLGGGATLFGLSGCVAVDDQGRGDGPLAYTPGYFIVYASAPGTSADSARAFGFPATPAAGGYSDKDYLGRNPCVNALFDTRNVVREPGGERLRAELKFTPPGAIVGRPKPYELRHRGGGGYTAVTPIEFDPPVVPRAWLWSFLNEEDRWLAVVGDYVALDAAGGEFEWAVTRADFYRLPGGDPVFSRSLQYLFWADDPTRGNDFGTDPPFCTPWSDLPAVVATAAGNMIAAGRLSTGAPLAVDRLVPTPEPSETPTEEPPRPDRPERDGPPGPDQAGDGRGDRSDAGGDGERRPDDPARDGDRSKDDEAGDGGRGSGSSDGSDDPGRSGDAGGSGGSDGKGDPGRSGDEGGSDRSNGSTGSGGSGDSGGSGGSGGSNGSGGSGGSDGSDSAGGSGDGGKGTPTETPTEDDDSKGEGRGGK